MIDRALGIGIGAKQLLRQLVSAGDVTDSEVQHFYLSMRTYFDTVLRYLISHLPLQDDFLRTLTWVDPTAVQETDAIMECAMR